MYGESSIMRWSASNGLKLNTSKCFVLHIAPQHMIQALSEGGVQVMLDGQALKVCDKIKTLGVILDKDLTFSEHVTSAIQRSLGRLRGLYRFRSLLPESAKPHLMQSLILSIFYYCYPAYGHSLSREDTERIQRIQNTAVDISTAFYDFTMSSYREASHLLSMDDFCRAMLHGSQNLVPVAAAVPE